MYEIVSYEYTAYFAYLEYCTKEINPIKYSVHSYIVSFIMRTAL